MLPVLKADYIEFPKSFSVSAPMRDPVLLSPISIPEAEVMHIEINDQAMKKFAQTKQDFTKSSQLSPVPNRDFIHDKLALLKSRSVRTLEPIQSLAPPLIPINMDTKSAGSNPKVSFGHGYNKKKHTQHRFLKSKLYTKEDSGMSESHSTPRLEVLETSSESMPQTRGLSVSRSYGKLRKMDFRNTD